MKLLFTFILLSGVFFGQSKKEQIEILTNRVDSLNTVLQTTRDYASTEIKELHTMVDGLNTEISELKKSLSEIESSVANLEKDKSKLTRENEKFKTDLEEMSKNNLELEAKVKMVNASGSEMVTENNYSKIINSLNHSMSGGNVRDWLERTVKNESVQFTDFMTKKCAEYANERRATILAGMYEGGGEYSYDDLVRKYGDDFDLNNSNWIHPFFGGQDTYGETDIKSLEYLGALNNGFWFKVVSCNPDCNNASSTKVVRVVKVIKSGADYKVDNFLSLSNF